MARRPALTPKFYWNDHGTVMWVKHAAPAKLRQHTTNPITTDACASLHCREDDITVITQPTVGVGGRRYKHFGVDDLCKAEDYILAWYKRTFTWAQEG